MIKNITERDNLQYSKCENVKILNLNSKRPATKQGKLKRVEIATALALSQLLYADYLLQLPVILMLFGNLYFTYKYSHKGKIRHFK